MNSKILLLTIAVISVGLFAMPTTLSLFAGQHTFDKAGNNTICVKCHSDIKTEIEAGSYHRTLLNSTGECRACHTSSRIRSDLIPIGNNTGNGTATVVEVGLDLISGNFMRANGTNISFGQGLVHAAVTVECKACHFNVTFTNDAHQSFADNASEKTWLRGANEACIGCHTKANLGFTWVRKGGYTYTYDFSGKSGVLEFNNTNVNRTTNNS